MKVIVRTEAKRRSLFASPVSTVEACRSCGCERLIPALDLGTQHIGNAFHRREEPPVVRAPLVLVRCGECSLVQLAHRVDCDLMYASYWYRSGINGTMREHLRALAVQAGTMAGLTAGDTVIDVGCNDGTLLACHPDGVRTIGVDPSDLVPVRCDAFVNDYFSAAALETALGGARAKLLTSIAMFYDLDDPKRFVRDVRQCLRDDGLWVLELSYLPLMLRAVSYDTVCHEHVTYYRLETFERVLAGSGMELHDVEFNDCNGGSFRLFVAPEGSRRATPRLLEAMEHEAAGGFATAGPYDLFKSRVERARRELVGFLERCSAEKKTVYGYGASTKGMVTLQYCGVTPSLMTAIAERNPEKWGLFTPGTDIPICSEEEMRAARPDYLVVLPWHFLREFLDRERDYLEAGGRLVTPLPSFAIHPAA